MWIVGTRHPWALRLAAAVASFATAAGLAACEVCKPGEVRCHDNMVQSCGVTNDGNGPNAWSGLSCMASTCKVVQLPGGDERALCVADVQPDPACAPTASSFDEAPRDLCDGPTQIACWLGHRLSTGSTCASARHCQSSLVIEGHRCPVSADPDPICVARPPGSVVCDGSTAVGCADGFRVREEHCGEGLCYTSPAWGAGVSRLIGPTCVASTTPDPRCTDAALILHSDVGGRFVEGCDMREYFRCVDGLVHHTLPCPDGRCDRTRPPCVRSGSR